LGSTIQLIQNLIGIPSNTVQVVITDTLTTTVPVYDTQYIVGAIILIIVINTICKLLLVIANRAGRSD